MLKSVSIKLKEALRWKKSSNDKHFLPRISRSKPWLNVQEMTHTIAMQHVFTDSYFLLIKIYLVFVEFSDNFYFYCCNNIFTLVISLKIQLLKNYQNLNEISNFIKNWFVLGWKSSQDL